MAAMKVTLFVGALATVGARTFQQRSLRGISVDVEEGKGELNFGSDACKCIGFQGVDGTTVVNIGNDTDYYITFPAEVGSYCKAWDDGINDLHCGEGDEPGKGNGFCGQPWCFVDACHCAGVKNPPKLVGHMMKNTVYKGMPLYYSFSTCGGEDLWTAGHMEKECTNAETEEECNAVPEDSCDWGDTAWGRKCLGWEAAGMCMELPEQSEWGDHDCPCVGLNGANTTLKVEDRTHNGDMGTLCQIWGSEYDSMCPGAPGCDQPWCFVDPSNCRIADKPQKSAYFPDATFQGHQLHYSYETCGGKRPTVEPKKEEPTEEPKKEEPKEDQTKQEAVEGNQEDSEDQEEIKELEGENDEGPPFDLDAFADEWHEEWRHH